MMLAGQLSFQGQLEQWSFDQAEALRAAGGTHWNETADSAFRGLCTLIERTGAFAVAIERNNAGLVQHWVAEHPRALEVAQSAALVAAALRGVQLTSSTIGDRVAMGMQNGQVASMCVAGDRHAVRTDCHDGAVPAGAANDVLQRLNQPGTMSDSPSLISLWLDLALAWAAPPLADGERAEPVIVTGVLRPAGPTTLEASTVIPIGPLGKLLGRINKPAKPDTHE
jgi:hypothetical protein